MTKRDAAESEKCPKCPRCGAEGRYVAMKSGILFKCGSYHDNRFHRSDECLLSEANATIAQLQQRVRELEGVLGDERNTLPVLWLA